jgi:hypothetical protein
MEFQDLKVLKWFLRQISKLASRHGKIFKKENLAPTKKKKIARRWAKKKGFLKSKTFIREKLSFF